MTGDWKFREGGWRRSARHAWSKPKAHRLKEGALRAGWHGAAERRHPPSAIL